MNSFFNLFTFKLGLPIDPFYSFLIMVAVGEITYRAAFSLVGDLYDKNLLQSSWGGSICHWIIRFFIYIITWAVLYGLILIGKFVYQNWKIILLINGCILVTAIFFKVKKLVKKSKKMNNIGGEIMDRNNTNNEAEQQICIKQIIASIPSAIMQWDEFNLVSKSIVNSTDIGSIRPALAQFRNDVSGSDYNEFIQIIKETNYLKEHHGNILSSIRENTNEILEITSDPISFNKNDIIDSVKIGSIAAEAARYQLDISNIDFTELTRTIKEENSLKESLGSLLSSIYDNVASSPYFYGWYNALDSTILETIKQQETLIQDFSVVDRLAVYEKCKLILYKFKWFPGAILTIGIRAFFKLIKLLSTINEEDDHLEEHIDNEIEAFFAETDIKRIKSSWEDSGLEEVIIRILGEALNAYLRGEYALTISALAPMWECLILKKLHVTCRQKSKLTKEQFGKLVLKNDYEKVFSDYYNDFIVKQCDGVDDIIEGVPNRHSFAHGWYKDYPTKKAALNAILLTDFIIGLEPKE